MFIIRHCFPCASTVVNIGFDPTDYTVNEETGEVTLTIVKLNATTTPVSVLFSTHNGTATGKIYPQLIFQSSHKIIIASLM